MIQRLGLLLSLLLFVPSVHAANEMVYNWDTSKLDYVTDTSAAGNVTAQTVAITSLDCTIYSNGGSLTTDASGNVVCSNDDTAAGTPDAPVDAQYLVSASNATLTDEDVVTEGLAIDYANGAGTGTFAVDPTELTGSRTFSDASTDTIVWTWNRATGTDPTLTFGSATVTGQSVAFTNLKCSAFTNGGKLTTDVQGNVQCGDDTSGGGSGSGDITDVNEGFAIDVTSSSGPAPTVAFDNTEFTGSRTWGDASTNTIVWTWDRLSGTDPTLTFGSATVTGQTVAMTNLKCSSFSNGGALTTDSSGNFICTDDNAASGTTPWQTSSNVVNLVTSTDNVTVGSASNLGKLAVDGDTDEIQLLIQGHSTQTSNLIVAETSAGTDEFTLTNAGVGTFTGSITAGGTGQSTITQGLVVNNGATGTSSDDFNVKGDNDADLLYIDVGNDAVTFGSQVDLGKVGIDGDADEIQLTIQGNATQTTSPFVLENSSGTDQVTMSNTGLISTVSLTASSTVTGQTVVATNIFKLPQGTAPSMIQTGTMAWDTTSGQVVVYNGTAAQVLPLELTKCATIENLVAADDNVPLYVFEEAATIQRTSCYTASMTTQPTYQLEDGGGNAVTGAATCSTIPYDWTSTTAGNSFGRSEVLRLDTTNTPAPTSGTYSTICWVYRQDRR